MYPATPSTGASATAAAGSLYLRESPRYRTVQCTSDMRESPRYRRRETGDKTGGMRQET